MKWIAFQNSESELKFSPSRECATVGAAESSLVRLKSKNMPPLHGQFAIENDQIQYRNFIERSVQTLAPESEIKILNWRASLLDEQDIWARYGVDITQSFRMFLRETQNLEEILKRMRDKFFFGEKMPIAIEEYLRKEMGDISLSSPVEALLSKPFVTDILVSGHDEIWVEENGELYKSQFKFSAPEIYQVYVENLLARVQKTIDDDRPYVDFVLPDGSRGHLIGPPISGGTYHLSIRKIRKDYFKLSDLLDFEMFNADTYKILRTALNHRKNILISGATGSGKTTLIRALIDEIPISQRVLVIEDTPELQLPRPNSVFLCSRAEGVGLHRAIDLKQLVKQSLRMRPDRIVVGEVRGEEAMDLLHAMNTGHRGCMGSLHANSARDALDRLQGLVQMSSARLSEPAIRDLISRNIHIVIHCGKSDTGKRQVAQIATVHGIDEGRLLLEVRE